MEKKIEEIIKQISETGYKSYDDTLAEYNELIEKSKKVQPDISDEARQAYVLNMLLGRAPHPLNIKGYILGVDREFDQNKKDRDRALKEGLVNETGEPIYVNMPENRKWLEGKPIPSPTDSTVRVCYFVGTTAKEGEEEIWKKATLWNRVKGLVPETMKLVEFKASGRFDKNTPVVGTLDGTQFKVLSEEPINFGEMSKAMLADNICAFEDIASFEQPKDYGLTIFRAQVVRATVTKDETKSNAVELRMVAETIEDVLKADSVENITTWCDKAVPLPFGEGDIVWCVGNKFTKQDGSYSMKGLGFFVERSSTPKNKPAPITKENSKATEEPQNWGGEVNGTEPSVEPADKPDSTADK